MPESAPTLDFVAAKRSGAPPQESLGQRIRHLRKAKGLTQTELGRRVGISPRMMAYYEIQGGVPSANLLGKLADALCVSLDVLAGRASAPRRPGETPEDFRLWRRLKRVAELPVHDQKTILKMIETMADATRRKAG